jgi:sugar lactone lactonase YvrE
MRNLARRFAGGDVWRLALALLSGAFAALLFLLETDPLPAGEVKATKFLLAWGKKGDKDGEFYSPIGICINKKDEVFVTDVNNSRIQKFSAVGKYLGGFELPRDEPKRKSCQIGGIASDGQGLLYLGFMQQHKIGVYTEDGKLVREWGKKGNGDGEFNQPGGIVLAPGGILFVTDQCNHRVQKFTTDGKFLGQWGKHGDKPGEFGAPEHAGSRFAGPHFLALDSKGRLYTTEGVAGRVQQITQHGKPLLAWGNKTNAAGGFGDLKLGYSKFGFGPIAVCVDKFDRVLVSSLNDKVQFFTPEGKFLFGLGGTGKEPGQFARPHGLAFDSQGHLYVCDAGNQRLQKFSVPSP